MAQVGGGGEEKGKGKGKRKVKAPPFIDMTPMVDLMCLLITFFMLTTAFTKSKVMEIVLPEKLQNEEEQTGPRIAASRTVNVILGPEDKVYMYPGRVEDFNNLPPLMETDYSSEGIRRQLLERNATLARRINDLEQEVLTGRLQISRDSLASSISRLKSDDDTGPIVLIKAYKDANYGNFVDILDEMNICGIARYTFMKIAWYEEQMVEIAAGISSTASPN
ncbi:MAG: biopolymer transporter ExbD [Bacteroidales bacterium]|jgi:biopolymer transport protein ExbD|nr:biopolymer transporter ExbD [Bacteroidales bacterium]